MSVQVHAHVQIKAPTVAIKAPTRREHRGEPIHSRPRPVVIHESFHNTVRPIVYSPAPIYTTVNYTPSYSYDYQPVIQLMGASPLDGQLAVNIDGLGNARTLELDAASGQTFVSQVTVYNANGTYQVIPVNQMLSASNPTVPLAIDNCAGVTQVVVDGHSQWGGQLAMRAF